MLREHDMDKKVPGISVPLPPDINAEEFVKVVESRRSVRRFTDDPVPDDIVNMIPTNDCSV